MMQSSTSKYRLSGLFITFVNIFLLTTTSIPVLASGKGHHHPDEIMSEHMQSMLAVKEAVPEEYRIMERTPVFPDEDSLHQGRKLFLQNCSVCHGKNGDGKGPSAAALETAPANFLDKKHSAIYGPGEKFWIIGHGTKETGMPVFEQISLIERWHLVNHILQLQQTSPEAHKEHGHH